MPTLLRMPDELYTQELAQVVAPQYALRTFQDALNGRPFYEPGFRSQVLEFLVRNYRAPAHLLDDAFNALLEDLKVARVLMLERMPMIRAYHWQPGSGDEKGRWVVPTYIFAEHRNMLQLALDNAKSDVPNAGIHEPQEMPTPKVPYRKAASPAPAALKPGADLVDRMAKHTSGEIPLSPEESIKLRKDLGKMNETLSPGEQFMVPDYSPEEQAYIDENNQKFANDIAMSYSVPSALLGVPTRGLGGSESQVAGAVNAGMALEGVGGAAVVGGNKVQGVKPVANPPTATSPKTPVVSAYASVKGRTFSDVNQTARPHPDGEKPTLIADKIEAKAAKSGKELPNGNMATAHAEVGAIQQAYDAGVTKDSDMILTVSGKPVCGYCEGDVAAMAEKSGLKTLTVIEKDTGKTLYWKPGMRRLKEY